jgi:hypothetical protein
MDETPASFTAGDLAKGRFTYGDTMDCYAVTGDFPTSEVALRVISKQLSPYETSSATATLLLFDSEEEPVEISLNTDLSIDPYAFVSADDVAYVCVEYDCPSGLCPDGVFYMLNITPTVLINEIKHSEDATWLGSFIELYGKPGYDLTGCYLEARAEITTDAGTPEESVTEVTPFSIDLETKDEIPLSLNAWGYLVVAHDTLTPGTTSDATKPDMFIPPLEFNQQYTSIAISLVCGESPAEEVIDRVCYYGDTLTECQGIGYARTKDGESMGRGFAIDTNRSDSDFMTQIEPTPWGRNLTEVK